MFLIPFLLNARLLYKPANELEPPLVFTVPWVGAGKGQLDLSNRGSQECGGLWRLVLTETFHPRL